MAPLLVRRQTASMVKYGYVATTSRRVLSATDVFSDTSSRQATKKQFNILKNAPQGH
jgi:hypothetical protein